MGYYEGNITDLTTGGGYNNGGFFGNDGFWGIILLAMIFGYGNNGFGFGGGAANGNITGYEMGKLATTNDVASGFTNNTVLRGLDDIQLSMSNNLNYINQGFSGLNTAITSNGYETRSAINDLGYKLQDCCCQTQKAIDGVNYNIAKSTCDIIQASHNDTQRIIDLFTSDKIESLNRKLSAAEFQLSQVNQNAYLVNALRPCPIPSYTVANPFCPPTTTTTTTA
jgi:hypothetical protein